MNPGGALCCPSCGEPALADDEFCESCGTPIGDRRESERKHVEIDVGIAAGVSDVGLVHRRNEDALFVAAGPRGAVAVVCDGVSSSSGSQVAAQVASQSVGASLSQALTPQREAEALGEPPTADPAAQAVADALVAAKEAVLEVPWMARAGRDAPSCTVVAALWDGTTVTIGWAGDSRAYWVGPDGVRRLTFDHSWAQEQIDAGVMTLAAAEADSRAHAITRWLGADAPPGRPAVATMRPDTGGRVVLCSDGLWNHLDSTDDLAALVGVDPLPALDIARLLTRAAIGRGGHDNVTVAVIDVFPGAQRDDHDDEGEER